MKKIITLLFTLLSFSAFASLDKLASDYNAGPTAAELVASGWAGNDGGRGFKVIQIVVEGTDMTAELHLDGTGKIVKYNRGLPTKVNFDFDYKMTSTKDGWAEMATGKNGPMYHMTPFVGALSFEGPMKEAMGNMGPFAQFLIVIGTNVVAE
jgi:putative sterol carrier protein